MGEILSRRIRQEHFESPLQEAFLNLLVASAHIRQLTESALAGFDITPVQFNVLRILRGVYPDGHPRCEIAQRMIERAPDVTRLLDKLEQKNLVERDRGGPDRRQSITRITKEGLDLLVTLQRAHRKVSVTLSRKLTDRDCLELSRICEQIYGE